MAAAPDLHQAPTDWQKLLTFARARGWSAEATNHGYVRFKRNGSVVFGPSMRASLEQLRECAKRLVHVERYGDTHGDERARRFDERGPDEVPFLSDAPKGR